MNNTFYLLQYSVDYLSSATYRALVYDFPGPYIHILQIDISFIRFEIIAYRTAYIR